MSIRKTFAERPWLFVVVGLGLMVSLTIGFVVIACLNPPVVIPK